MTLERAATQLHFVEPLPGFGDDDSYTLSAIDPDGLLFSLRSVKHPDLRFVLAPARAFFPEYEPDVSGALPGEVEVLVMLTLGTGLADATANLRAPIAISSQGQAVQVILEDASLPMHRPLLAA